MSRKVSSSAPSSSYRRASSTGSPASTRSTKLTPLTTRPSETSRHGMTRTATDMPPAYEPALSSLSATTLVPDVLPTVLAPRSAGNAAPAEPRSHGRSGYPRDARRPLLPAGLPGLQRGRPPDRWTTARALLAEHPEIVTDS